MKNTPQPTAWTPEQITARLAEIQRDQYIGPIAPAMPMPKVRGHTRQLARLQGVTVWAFFEQFPPEGSIPVGREGAKWRGNLLFLDPAGQLWTVPHVWYNATWRSRMEHMEWSATETNRKLAEARTELARLNAKSNLNALEKTQISELKYTVREAPEKIARLECSAIRRRGNPENLLRQSGGTL